MTFRIRARLMIPIAAIAAAVSVAAARQAVVTTNVREAPLSQTVPADPLITIGTLPNGLRYYIRANKQPQTRAELRLVVNAGSVLEDDDQRGLAHFVEHMSFNGTLHFPQQTVAGFMQSLGMRFGAHVNAHTSFDETVYEMQVPTDNPVVMDQSLLILEDWAHNVTFDPQAIDKERGIVLEEWRLGLGANERIQDAQLPILLSGSRYAERLPIGKPDIIRNVNHDRLKQFYADWYRPDLMAVIAVGDFDTAVIEALIKSHFSSIPAASSPKPRLAYTVPDQPGTRYSVITDPEATVTHLGVYGKMAAREQATVGAYRRQMVEGLFSGMLSARLDEMAEQPNAPFLKAGTGRRLLIRAEETTTLDALVAEGGVERGLSALFTEIDRVARFGFTATELNRQRLNLQRGLQIAVVEKDKSPSRPLAEEFVRNFIHGEPLPGIVNEFALNQRFLPQITLAEVNGLAREWLPDRNRLVVVSAPGKDRGALPSEATLVGVIAAASGGPLTAYVDTVSTQPLLARLPSPGSIAATTANEALGLTEWQLSNGVRVVLKPTAFKQDEILFRAASPGGTSLANDQELVPAQTASEVIAAGGLGNFGSTDLSKLLAGTNVGVGVDIGETEERVAGGASSKDLETMFQLIYLRFTAPRADPAAFRVLTQQMKVALAHQDDLPESAFTQALNAVLSQNHPRAQPMTAARVDQMDLDKSLAFYKARFADASNFTFVFVGSFDLATMKPLVERYLASLPASHQHEVAKDVGVHPPAGVVKQQVRRGLDPKSQVSIVYTGPFQNDERHRVVLRAMAATLAGNLHRTLREELGGTYGVSVEPRFTNRPVPEYRVTISFGCDPTRTESLVRTAFQVIEEFRRVGPGYEQVAAERTALTRDFETSSQRNEYLVDRLLYKYGSGEDVKEAFDMRPLFNELTAPTVREAAQTYLNPTRYVEVTLLPEAR
jgi:zinc protease